ncbi:macrolide transport system ATP-binding/permease protein [Peribacillus simplex]|uniref:ribosomal protection-like ABC-F family protein n=1 Tax=Peribacillus simplex TaxID=1478 RepID=UPI0024E23C11|nr:ABC-F type ribosomal protection protein [Peribacillus simplex]MDF9762105.1 macrolide transport system ATP-binding/permease protein [Peribacillus simplex]
MLFLKANDLKKSYGNREVISVDSLHLYSHDRVGLVGRNGEGKTTLLSILAGVNEPDSGHIESYGTVSYIPQIEENEQEISGVLTSIWKLPDEDQEMISGGERTRRKIAAALTSNADVLIADEPTSHLDVFGIEQLEKDLKSFNGAILLTSHDKAFLNHLCTTIWEVEQGKVTVYEGNYEAYTKQKQAKTEKEKKEFEEYTREKNRLKQAAQNLQGKSDSIRKAPKRMGNSEARLHKRSAGKQKAKLNRSAEAIETRIEKLAKKEKPREDPPIIFDISEFPSLHSKRVIRFNGCSLKVGSRMLKQHIYGDVPLACRLAINGQNGSGKSTLLKKIVKRHTDIYVAKPAKIGFFAQQQENLNESKTVLENILEDSPYNQAFIRTLLSRLAFKENDVHKQVSLLSGGERVRASLAKVFLGNYNVLVLDEPTNYLDINTKEALIEVLKAYPGTIVFVSHDRSLIQSLATHVLSLEDEPLRVRTVNQESTKLDKGMDGHQVKQDELLMIEVQIIDTLGKLSRVMKEEEKEELDREYLQLLNKKKELED